MLINQGIQQDQRGDVHRGTSDVQHRIGETGSALIAPYKWMGDHFGWCYSGVDMDARRWKADGGGPFSRRWRIESAHSSELSMEVSTSRS